MVSGAAHFSTTTGLSSYKCDAVLKNALLACVTSTQLKTIHFSVFNFKSNF